ncbi:15_t:CDS:2 [Ambispora gerdemannii]|uniref:15_t:CDS:1 n=1 Tax=Ambispora gerdemannii TaxID=144530 RepID=A0A9N9BKY1_9GLOM|nr:15_t:CDS:2 [Ambispora gerdemannii]
MTTTPTSPTIQINRIKDDSESDSEEELIFEDALEFQPPETETNLLQLWDDTALSDTSSVMLETTDDERSLAGDETGELSPPLPSSQRSSYLSQNSMFAKFPSNKRQTRLYSRAAQSIPVLPTRGTIKRLSKRGSNLSAPLVEETDMDLEDDLREVRQALDRFFNSRMNGAEDLLMIKSKTSMYHSLGYSFIIYLKSLMTFEPADIEKAISALKVTVQLASSLRKRDRSISNFVRGGAASVNALKSMNRIQRHAELVYAEAYLLKAVLSIFYDNALVSFIRESINIRNSYIIFRNLAKFMECVKDDEDITTFEVDSHFSSGVSLGIGIFNLILSLLPPGILKIMHFVGFTSDRSFALRTLEFCGGWIHDSPDSSTNNQNHTNGNDHNNKNHSKPEIDIENEGLRRPFCDLALLSYHLIISNLVPVADADLSFASKILNYNLRRYPNGVLFLYFSGRLHQSESYMYEAIAQYKSAINIQKQWKQLHHICYWEMALNYQCLMDFEHAYECFKTLCKESMWSKCVYLFQQAVCLYTLGRPEDMDRVIRMMRKVPKLMQPRKFVAQGHRLLLPACELTYVWNSYDVMPLVHLLRSLSIIEITINNLDGIKERDLYINFWDDFCLAYLLRGVILSKIAFPNNPNHEDEKTFNHNKDNVTSTCATAIASLQYVVRNGPNINLDHYLIHFARYELGRLFTNMREFGKAKAEFEKVLDGGDTKDKKVGGYSLENMLLLRTYNAMVKLDLLQREVEWEEHEREERELMIAS